MSRKKYNKGDFLRLRKELDINWNLLLDPLHYNNGQMYNYTKH